MKPNAKNQNKPLITPLLSTSIFSAAGIFGSPGMVMISPSRPTTNPAPAETLTFLTVTVKFYGAPSFDASSEKEYCVFAMQTGQCPNPSFSRLSICFDADGR